MYKAGWVISEGLRGGAKGAPPRPAPNAAGQGTEVRAVGSLFHSLRVQQGYIRMVYYTRMDRKDTKVHEDGLLYARMVNCQAIKYMEFVSIRDQTSLKLKSDKRIKQ
jgi:hypothetical protein